MLLSHNCYAILFDVIYEIHFKIFNICLSSRLKEILYMLA